MSATVFDSVRVRTVRQADAAALAAVHVASWHDAYRGILPDAELRTLTFKRERRRWRGRIARSVLGDLWIIEADDEVVGFTTLGPCFQDRRLLGFAGELFMLYIHPLWQGRGLGRILMRRVMDELASREHRWLVVWVLEANVGAQRFYERFRLRPDGARRLDRVRGGRVPVVRMGGPLGDALY